MATAQGVGGGLGRSRAAPSAAGASSRGRGRRGGGGRDGGGRGGGRGRGGGASREQIAINRELVGAAGASEVEALCRRSLAEFNIVNAVTALQRLAKTSADQRVGAGGRGGRGGRTGARGGRAGQRQTAGLSETESSEQLRAELVERTLALLREEGGACEARHLSGALWSAARLGLQAPELEAMVLSAAAGRAGQFKPQELSNTLWAAAKLSSKASPADIRAMATAAAASIERNLRDWTPQGLSNVAWSAGSLGLVHVELVRALLHAVTDRAGELNPQELANTIWAFAKIRERCEEILSTSPTNDRSAGNAKKRGGKVSNGVNGTDSTSAREGAQVLVEILSPASSSSTGLLALKAQLLGAGGVSGFSQGQHLANVLWGASRLGIAEGGLLSAFAEVVSRRARDLNPQEISMACWALASAGEGGAAMSALVSASQSQLMNFNARQLATLVWSMAKVGCWDGGLASALPQHLRRVTAPGTDCSPQDLTNTLWGFAKMEARDEEVLRLLGDAIKRLLDENHPNNKFSTQHLTLAIWSLGVLSESPLADVTTALLDEAGPRLGEFNSRDLTNTMAGLALLGVRDKKFLRRFGDEAVGKLAAFNSQELLKFLGAFRATGATHAKLSAALAEERSLEYEFPSLRSRSDRRVTLLSALPRKFSEDEKGSRVDNSCGGGGRGNTGVALWEGSYVLAEWLSRQHLPAERTRMQELLGSAGMTRGASIKLQGGLAVELGAGLGLPSVLAAKQGMQVVSTDGVESVLDLLRKNLQRNCPKAEVRQLVWGSPDPRALLRLERAPDVVLAADVVYGNDPVAWQALVHSMAQLGDDRTLFLLANMQRYPLHHPLSEVTFLNSALAAQFCFVRLPQSALHVDYQRTGAGSCAIYAFQKRPGAAPPSLDLQHQQGTPSGQEGKQEPKKKKQQKLARQDESGDQVSRVVDGPPDTMSSLPGTAPQPRKSQEGAPKIRPSISEGALEGQVRLHGKKGGEVRAREELATDSGEGCLSTEVAAAICNETMAQAATGDTDDGNVGRERQSLASVVGKVGRKRRRGRAVAGAGQSPLRGSVGKVMGLLQQSTAVRRRARRL